MVSDGIGYEKKKGGGVIISSSAGKVFDFSRLKVYCGLWLSGVCREIA